MKKTLILIIFSLIIMNVNAKEANITKNCNITVNNNVYDDISDGKYTTYEDFKKNDVIKIKCEEEVNYIYIYYNKKASKGKLNNIEIGNNGFLHELIKLNDKEKAISIKYEEDYSIADIYIFNTAELPEWVEDWQVLDKADLMLFSTHGDDEHLFFAGLMPTYIDKGKKIQVVYFTNHYNNTNRYHEQLEGLWTIGIKYYPVFSTFPDEHSLSGDEALELFKKNGFTAEDALKYEVEQIRRYKPLVVVGHDEKGEYGHGQHILNTNILKEAIIKANDSSFADESIKKYGLWNISKLYLHLYHENQLILNYDLPLKTYDNKTAYEMSKLGFAKHKSQQFTWFTAWLNGENNEYQLATEIEEYNPAYYGLYYSSVGEDLHHNDMFENTYEKNISIIPIQNVIQKIKKNVKNNSNKKTIGIILIIVAIIGLIIPKKHK